MAKLEKNQDKAYYRQTTLAKLKAKDATVRKEEEEILKNKLVAYIKENDYKNIGFYYGFSPELNTRPIFDDLSFVSIYLPRMLSNRRLSFHLFDEDKLETAWKNIQQPTEESPQIEKSDLDLIIVPGLAFMPNGYRIGFGGGYYDRFLAGLDVDKLSVLFPEQIYPEGEWQADSFDIPVDKIITI